LVAILFFRLVFNLILITSDSATELLGHSFGDPDRIRTDDQNDIGLKTTYLIKNNA